MQGKKLFTLIREHFNDGVTFELNLEVNVGARHGKGRESVFQTLNGLSTKVRWDRRLWWKVYGGR